MKHRRPLALILLAAITCAGLAAVPAPAQDPAPAEEAASQPVVVVSVASVDKVLGSIDYLARTAGTPQFGALAQILTAPYLQGIDTQKSAGMYTTVDQEQASIVFVPVSDYDRLIMAIEQQLAEPEQMDGGVMKLNVNERSVYFKHRNGWVFISEAARNLENLPEDPTATLGGLQEQYDLAAQVNVQNIPAEFRQMAVAQMKSGFEQSLEQTDEQQREVQEKFGKPMLDNFVRFFEEAEQLVVGWGVDQQEATTYLDFNVVAQPDTTLAKQMATLSEVENQFGNFLLADAAATLQYAASVTEEEMERAKEALQLVQESALEEIEKDEDLSDEQAREAARQLVRSTIDVLQQTVESGKLEGAGSLVLDGAAAKIVGAAHVADGSVVEKNLKEVIELAKQSDETADVEFRSDQHGDVKLQIASIPVPEKEEEARQILGDRLVVVLGTGPKSIYLAMGQESVDLLKEVLDGSADAQEAEAMPFELTIALAPVLQFASQFEDDPALQAMAEAASKAEGQDHIRVTAKPLERGVSYRILLEEGVLQLIGRTFQMQGQNPGF